MTENRQPLEEQDPFSFYGFDDQGRRVKCDAIMTFDLEEDGGGKVRVVFYTDRTTDASGGMKLYAAQYPDGVNLQTMTEPPLEPLREELWGAVEEVFENVFQQSGPDGVL